MRQHDAQTGSYIDLIRTIPLHTRICIRADVRISANTQVTLSPRPLLKLRDSSGNPGSTSGVIAIDVDGYLVATGSSSARHPGATDLPGKWHSYSLLFVRDVALGAYTVIFGIDGAVIHTVKLPPTDLVVGYRAGAPSTLWREPIDVDVDNFRVRLDP